MRNFILDILILSFRQTWSYETASRNSNLDLGKSGKSVKIHLCSLKSCDLTVLLGERMYLKSSEGQGGGSSL